MYKSPPNPILELMKIINKDVPIACFMGNLAKNNSAGIIKNPPPAPKKPVTIQTKKPIIPSWVKFVLPVVTTTLFFLIMDIDAAIMSIEKTIMIKKLFDIL